MTKQAILTTITKLHNARIDRAKADGKFNDNMERELLSAMRLFKSESAVSYMLRDKDALKRLSQAYTSEAQKTLVKVARTMIALVTRDVNALDKHTLSILRNAHALAEKRAYSYQELQTMQSTLIASNVSAKLANSSDRRAYSATTTQTQTSTSVHALAFFGIVATETRERAAKYVTLQKLDRAALRFVFDRAESDDE